jgi:hypothetical protein
MSANIQYWRVDIATTHEDMVGSGLTQYQVAALDAGHAVMRAVGRFEDDALAAMRADGKMRRMGPVTVYPALTVRVIE